MDMRGNKTSATIDKYDFLRFVLDKINIKPRAFCSDNGWQPLSHKRWKHEGVPKRVWKALEKELIVHNLTTFHNKYKENIIYIEELEKEYLEHAN